MKFLKIKGGKSKPELKNRCFVCFRALSAPARFRLFVELKKKKKANVETLVRRVSLRQPTVTFHLNLLAKAGLVRKKKMGREVYLTIYKPCDQCFLFD